MGKNANKKTMVLLSVLCFVVVTVLAFFLASNLSAFSKASKALEPWSELYHCVDMRIGNYDSADMTQMNRYYSVLKSNPYIYAALSESERDYFTADKSVLYRNMNSYEQIVDNLKQTITFELIGGTVFLAGGVFFLIKSKNKQTQESFEGASICVETKPKNTQMINSSGVSSQKDNIEAIKKFKELLDSGAITQEEFEKLKKELLNL